MAETNSSTTSMEVDGGDTKKRKRDDGTAETNGAQETKAADEKPSTEKVEDVKKGDTKEEKKDDKKDDTDKKDEKKDEKKEDKKDDKKDDKKEDKDKKEEKKYEVNKEFNDYHEYITALHKAFEAGQVVVTYAFRDSSNGPYLYDKFWTQEIVKAYKNREDIQLYVVQCDGKEMTRKLQITKKYPTVFFYPKGSKAVTDYVRRECFHKDQPNLLLIAVHDFIFRNTDNPNKYIYKEPDLDDTIWRTPFIPEYVPIHHPLLHHVVGHELCVQVHNEVLLDYIRKKTKLNLYGESKQAKFHKIEMLYEKLQSYRFLKTEPFQEFAEFIIGQTKAARDNAQKMINEGCISFEYLKYLFKVGDKIVGTRDKLKLGAIIKNIHPAKEDSYSFRVDADIICSNGEKVYFATDSFYIYKFYETTKLKDLEFHHISDEEIATLTARGKKFRQIAIGAHHQHLDGYMFRSGWYSKHEVKAQGRVMIDPRSSSKMSRGASFKSSSKDLDAITDDLLWMTWPTIHGFSFTTKQWGEMPVEQLKDIEFDEIAFEKLVLPPTKKRMISAFVKNAGGAFTDIIKGKGAGCIFLLHGPPGTGKTLTAEAIAEYLHRPLYSISVGELGVDTSALEKNLHDILELASVWKAVVLLDEADIFLEARSTKDIKRNAMVGVFLRLLEYHNGVLFLTTNRVKCFDEAFHSRISVALHYTHLDQTARSHIWHNLLEAAGVPHYFDNKPFLNPAPLVPSSLVAEKLGEYEINGRQIRTTIRLSQTLAASEAMAVQAITMDHIQMCVDIALQFVQATAKDGDEVAVLA